MTSTTPLVNAITSTADALLPPIRVSLSEWSDSNVRLSSEGSSQAGHWSTFVYQKEPLNAMAPHSPYSEVV